MKDALLSSKELWACYQCGECAETCPTQADPSEFMAATRRYAIASYDRTRLARTMYTRPDRGDGARRRSSPLFFAAFMYAAHGPMDGESLAIFEFIPAELIHDTGIVVMILVVLAGIAGDRDDGPRHRPPRGRSRLRRVLGSRAALARTGRALVDGDRPRVARPAPLPRGVRRRPRRPVRALVPPALAGPRPGGLGVPRPARRDRARLRARAGWASRRPARPSRSGTRSGCWAPWPARSSCTGRPC